MTTRFLPPEEYGKLAGTELESVVTMFPPDTKIIVVEDTGRVVGCWAMPRYLHVEGLWIHPAYRKGAAVGRQLVRAMRAEARRAGDPVVLTAALTPEIADWCLAVGGAELPGRSFVLPIPIGG